MKHEFETRTALIDGFVDWCLDKMRQAVSENGSANVLLSGGGTPGPAYQKLNEECDFLNAVHFGLVDERNVEQQSEFSNERLIRNCFSNAASNHIHGMVYDLADADNNLSILTEKYARFTQRTDLLILGMGPDGHTASLFPNDPESDAAMRSRDSFMNTNAPAHPTQRITCTLDMINNAQTIALLITGTNKLEVLENTALKLPIHRTIQTCPDIEIFYAE